RRAYNHAPPRGYFRRPLTAVPVAAFCPRTGLCYLYRLAMSSARDPDAKNIRLFDVRTVERNIKKGLITRKDYDKHLKALEDAQEKVSQQAEAAGDDLDDDEDNLDDLDDDEPEAA